MRLFHALVLLIALCCFQCQSPGSSQQEGSAETVTENTTPAPNPPPANTETPTSPYPSITQEKMTNLFENCDYVDFVFYSTNFSMSQNTQAAIRSTLGGISTTPAKVISTCKPVGRVFFQIDGVNAEEADLFFGGSCLYYLFLENGTYAYGNQMTEGGFGFYKNIFDRVSTQSGGQ